MKKVSPTTLVLLLVAIVVTGFAVAVPLTRWITQPHAVSESFVMAVMILFVLIFGVIPAAVLIALGVVNGCLDNFNVQSQESIKWRDYVGSWEAFKRFAHLPGDCIAFILFAKFAIVLGVWEAIDAGYCMRPLLEYNNPSQQNVIDKTVVRHQLLIALSAFQVFFICLQIVILLYRVHGGIVLPHSMKQVMKLVIIGNIIGYAYAYLIETEDELHFEQESADLLANMSVPNIPQRIVECLNHSARLLPTTNHKYVDRLKPYLYPVTVEFYLSSSVLVVSLLERGGSSQMEPTVALSRHEVERVAILFFLQEPIIIARAVGKLIRYFIDRCKRYCCLCKDTKALFVVFDWTILAVALTQLILGICIVVQTELAISAGVQQTSVSFGVALIYNIFDVLISFIMFGLAGTLLHQIRKLMKTVSNTAVNDTSDDVELIPTSLENDADMHVNGYDGTTHDQQRDTSSNTIVVGKPSKVKVQLGTKDFLLIFATVGLTFYHLFVICGMFTLISDEKREEAMKLHISAEDSFFSSESKVILLGSLSVARSFILGAEVLMQTAVIIFAHGIDFSTATQNIQGIAFCKGLALCNLLMWVTSSLTLSSVRHTDPISVVVFSKETWVIISRCIFPMMLFYRLHSVHLLFETGNRLFGEFTAPKENE